MMTIEFFKNKEDYLCTHGGWTNADASSAHSQAERNDPSGSCGLGRAGYYGGTVLPCALRASAARVGLSYRKFIVALSGPVNFL